MFDSNSTEQKISVQNQIAFRDRYPSTIINIHKLELVEISEDSNISFLRRNNVQVLINNNIKFVIHKDLAGIITLGKFRIWYSILDGLDRYIKIMMVEGV